MNGLWVDSVKVGIGAVFFRHEYIHAYLKDDRDFVCDELGKSFLRLLHSSAKIQFILRSTKIAF
ncbi:hypothetical protein C7120_05240 [Prevotella sp. oral taxon 376]|nr:hypothetical protein C7120_05240 [Prevotella sp. oral taxon 376]